jgi:peptidylamidoglycolate lyase
MRRHLQNRRTLRRASFAFVALAVALIATVNNGALSAAQNSYHLVEGWPQIPASVPVSGMVSWVDVDSKGLLYLFRRCPIKCSDGPHPGSSDPPGATLLFDPSGRYLGEFEPKSGGKPKEAHAIRIDRHGFIWTTDVQLNVVRKYSSDGTLLMTLGKVGVAGETPELMNKPTDVLVAADDTIFVTDGYGNQRVVKFTKEGRFVKAWGKKGTAPGEFRIPHTIVQDRAGRIIVGD